MSDFATIMKRSALIFERDLPGPIERVWSYLTDPKLLALWFDEGSVAGRIGGDVHFEMGMEGRVTAYEPPHVLEYTWNEDETPGGPIANSVLRWELAAVGDRVHLKITHTRLPESALVSHGAGWHAFLDRLAACIEGREPAAFTETYERLEPEYKRYLGSGTAEGNNGKARL